METWGAAIASLLGIILFGLRQWQSNAPQREKARRDADIQKIRKAAATGDVDAVSRELDIIRQRLHNETKIPPGGQPSLPDKEGGPGSD